MASLYPTAAPRAGGAERSEHGQAARSEAPEADSGAASAAPGLVICAISPRVSEIAGQKPVFSDNSFRNRDECRAAAARHGGLRWDGREGPVPMLQVSPGLVRVTAPDLNRRERTANKNADRPAIMPSETDARRGDIRGWSRKSRARMIATLSELDLAPLYMSADFPAMITLTYPGAWETVAPDGAVVKRHLESFFSRYRRSWGENLRCVWKLEFQRRGAPHFHLLMVPPVGRAGEDRRHDYELRRLAAEKNPSLPRPRWRGAVGDGKKFRDWLSLTWADIIAHPDPEERAAHERAGTAVDYAEGARARDPRGAAVYFAKHGSYSEKEYQNEPPAAWRHSKRGVGRIWGYRGLSKALGGATITPDEQLFFGRILARWSQRQRKWSPERGYYFMPAMRRVERPREIVAKRWISPAGVEIRRYKERNTLVRARRMSGSSRTGFILCGDGVAMADLLLRARHSCLGERSAPVGMRGPISDRLP